MGITTHKNDVFNCNVLCSGIKMYLIKIWPKLSYLLNLLKYRAGIWAQSKVGKKVGQYTPQANAI